jgi:homoserine dehydrogenase
MTDEFDDIEYTDVALLGFGNVGRALGRLIVQKNPFLQAEYGVTFRIVGIGTGRRGFAINPDGLDIEAAIQAADAGTLASLHRGDPIPDALTFIQTVPAQAIAETTPLNTRDGQPALDYLHAALSSGKHAVTANKGPVAFGYHVLRTLAEEEQRAFFFESSALGGAPIIDLYRECLIGTKVFGVRGVFNSTTNSILDRMRQGVSFEDAVREMQERGLAETDPSHDVDGWDSAVKLVILANVLMGADLRPNDIDRTGIRGVTYEELTAAMQAGKTIRLLCDAHFEDGQVRASVRPTALPNDDPVANNFGPTNTILFETEELHLQVTEHHGTPRSTAYGMLRDLINIARGRY